MSDQTCLTDWAPDPDEKMLGFLRDADGIILYDSNGPVRVISGPNSPYKTYEEFERSEDWKELVRRYNGNQ